MLNSIFWNKPHLNTKSFSFELNNDKIINQFLTRQLL